MMKREARTLALKEAGVAVDVLHMTPRRVRKQESGKIEDFILKVKIPTEDRQIIYKTAG